MNRPHVISLIKEVLYRNFPDLKVILYRSEARGDVCLYSDIDLLLLVNKDAITLDDRMKQTAPLYDIELETEVQINIFIETVQK